MPNEGIQCSYDSAKNCVTSKSIVFGWSVLSVDVALGSSIYVTGGNNHRMIGLGFMQLETTKVETCVIARYGPSTV